MSTDSERPDVEHYIRPLKPFQRDAVIHIFDRMFAGGESASQSRFLLADEVGLGKTLVARGVIARAVDWFWDRVDRVDIVYVCSNRNIAAQNVNRLNITNQQSLALPTRLTMLPLLLPEISNRKLNLVSLTPGTSFELAYRSGRYEERVLLYHMLQKIWNLGASKRYVNLLRCRKGHDSWRREIDRFGKQLKSGEKKLNSELVEAFADALDREDRQARWNGESTLREQFEEAADLYKYKRTTERPDEHRDDQYEVVGKLRRLLADVSVDYLTADLVILDEFQRFKSLLDGNDTDAQLAQRLFESASEQPHDTRLLLLSATPYKMYTMHHEASEDDHYEDFFRTLDFLYGDDKRKEEYKSLLKRYRHELLGSATSESRLANYKSRIESILRNVMLRTERFKEIRDQEGLIEEITEQGSLAPKDIEQYAAARRLRQDYDVHNLLQYWKAAPYLPSFMGKNYNLKAQINTSLDPEEETGLPSQETIQVLEELSINYSEIQTYEAIDLANSRIRELVQTMIAEPQSWQILWIPASLPYWKHRGPYLRPAGCGFTKSLVFSTWKMVPDVISVLGTYEAERRMMAASQYDYDEIGDRATRLTFQLEDGKPSEMASMALFYPCLSLARMVDPAHTASQQSTAGVPPSYETVRKAIASRIASLLTSAGVDVLESGQSDIRHFWKYMAHLDAQHESGTTLPRIYEWLNTEDESIRWQSMVGRDGEAKGFSTHVDRLKKAFRAEDLLPLAPEALGRLADIAISAPATVALRALLRHCKPLAHETLPTLLGSAARIALGFRRRFNQPWITECLTADDDSPYWEIALDHCRDGNLQSVLDEFYHVIRESEGLIDHTADETAHHLSEYTDSVLSIRPASLNIETFTAQEEPHQRSHKMRTHFALRLGDDKEVLDSDHPLRGDIVRKAFNSPFHPFILSTTSIGQEGLDFHQFCHSIFHWNLPANPVDLEQREGRINRYKGHVIRRNVAASFGLDCLEERQDVELFDPWKQLFDLAKKKVEDSTRGLQPDWIYEAEDAFKIRRHVPSVPFSEDNSRLETLKDDLTYYRLAFGQPRQQDLIDHLRRKYSSLSSEEIKQKVREQYIDLSPPER